MAEEASKVIYSIFITDQILTECGNILYEAHLRPTKSWVPQDKPKPRRPSDYELNNFGLAKNSG